MNVKKNDFIEISYTGIIKDENKVFDTTDEKVAKENNLSDSNIAYKPLVVVVGKSNVIAGLDKALDGKEVGKEYEIEVRAEDAFGKKDPKLFQLINTRKFREQKINPMPGLGVHVDNFFGIIKTVTGGRTLVDFNHPLAGKDLIYRFKINRTIEDDEEKAKALLGLILHKEVGLELKENNLVIHIALGKELEDKIKGQISEFIPTIKTVDFKVDDKK